MQYVFLTVQLTLHFSLMANYWTERLSMLATKDTIVMPK